MSVETNPPPSPSPRSHLYNFEFFVDLANKESVGSCQGIHKYVLQLHFRNHLVNFSFVKCPMFLMLLVLPMLYISLVI